MNALTTRSAPPRRPVRRTTVVALAVVTVGIECLGSLGVVPSLPIGSLDIAPAVIPGLLLAIACGDRLVGRSSHRVRAALFWGASAGLLLGLGIVYVAHDRSDLWVGLVTAALGEELVYRLAIPLVAAIVLRRLGVAPGRARLLGFALAAAWFIALPGHTAQIESAKHVGPFIAFATLSAVVVYRSGSVLPMAVAHAITNLLTVLLWSDIAGMQTRTLGLVLTLGLLIAAYGERRRWTIGDSGELVDTTTGQEVAVLDLRDGRPVSVTLVDGTVLDAEALDALPDATGPTPIVATVEGEPTHEAPRSPQPTSSG